MDWNEDHKRNLSGYEGEINQAYNNLINEVAALTVKAKLTDELFSFAKQKLIKDKIEKAFQKYQSRIFEIISNGITKEWDFANTKNDALRQEVLDRLKSELPAEKYNQLSAQRSPRNTEALEAFQNRKRGKFTISDRVWNLANNARTELEFAIDLGLSKGSSANEIARSIKSQLNQPDKLFRRVRDKHGNLVASKAMKNYHSGKGVYRNANQNALRFSSNEINIAYKESDCLRMSQNKDVVGYKVFLSPQHTIYDMCDELKGNYPKDFKFNGWHVRCKCGVLAILKSDEEFIKELKADQELEPKTSKNFVPDVPENFNKWIKENKERVSGWKSQPNFMRDNQKFVEKAAKY